MNNLDKQYIELINHVLETGYRSGDRTGTGTIKTFGNLLSHNMQEGFPLLTTKKMFTKGIIHELLWFLKGDTNIKYLVDNNVYIWVGDCYKKYKEYANSIEEPDYFVHVDDPIQNCTRIMTEQEFIEAIKTNDAFAAQFGELNKVYGAEWTNWNDDINQVQELIDALKTNPDSRRMLVTAWNPTNVRKALLPPCHLLWQVFSRELSLEERIEIYGIEKINKNDNGYYEHSYAELILNNANVPKRELSLMFYMRSVDVGLGLPFDIASYGFLLSMIAAQVNMKVGELKFILADTHIYVNQIDGLKEQVTREPLLLPKLKLNPDVKSIFDYTFDDIEIVDYVSHDKIFLPLSN